MKFNKILLLVLVFTLLISSVSAASLNANVKDPNGNELNIGLEIYNPGGQLIYNSNGKGQNPTTPPGLHTVIVKPNTGQIKQIQYNDLDTTNQINGLVDINPVMNKNGIKGFAINPIHKDFTTADVTITSTGGRLVKCKDWTFETNTCFGNWEIIADNLIAGQEYTFQITPDDPGFYEIPITLAEVYNQTGDFREDITADVDTLDGNYTNPIYHGETIRITFNETLYDYNDITVASINPNQTDVYIDVYKANTTEYITTFSSMLEEKFNRVLLTNMTGTEIQFDLKVISPTSDPDAYIIIDLIKDPLVDCTPFFTINVTDAVLNSGGTVACNDLHVGSRDITITNTNLNVGDFMNFTTTGNFVWTGGSVVTAAGNGAMNIEANNVTFDQNFISEGFDSATVNKHANSITFNLTGILNISGNITSEGEAGVSISDSDERDAGIGKIISITATEVYANNIQSIGGLGGSTSAGCCNQRATAGGASNDVIITTTMANVGDVISQGGNGGSGSEFNAPGAPGVTGDITITSNMLFGASIRSTGGNAGGGDGTISMGAQEGLITFNVPTLINLTGDVEMRVGNTATHFDNGNGLPGRSNIYNLTINTATLIANDIILKSGIAGSGSEATSTSRPGGNGGRTKNININTSISSTINTILLEGGRGGNGAGSNGASGGTGGYTEDINLISPSSTILNIINKAGNAGLPRSPSTASNEGRSGNINVNVNTYTSTGNITTTSGINSGNTATSGNISIITTNLIANNINSFANAGTGTTFSGNIGIIATSLMVNDIYTSSTGTGITDSGNINITSQIITANDIYSQAAISGTTGGDSGSINIISSSTTVDNIYSKSGGTSSPGIAGTVYIDTFDLVVNQSVTSRQGDGTTPGGNTNITVRNLLTFTEFPTIENWAIDGYDSLSLSFYQTTDGTISLSNFDPVTKTYTYSYSDSFTKLLLMHTNNLAITQLPAAFTNISITDIQILNTSKDIWLGDIVPINFTIVNDGSGIESATVDLRIDGTPYIASIPITNLGVGESRTLQTNWDTTGFSNTVHTISINLTTPVNSQGILSQGDTRKVEYATDVLNVYAVNLFPDTAQIGDVIQSFFIYQNAYVGTAWEQLRFEIDDASPGFTVDTPIRYLDIPAGVGDFEIYNITANQVGQYNILGIIGNNEINVPSPLTLKIFPETDLFFEPWETGTITANWTLTPGPSNSWVPSTTTPFAGVYSLRAVNTDGRTTVTSVPISTEFLSQIELSYAYDYNNLDVGEYFQVEWYDGVTWNMLQDVTGSSGGWQTTIIALPTAAENNPNFQIRFSCLNSANNEYCANDNINITALNTNPLNPINLDPASNGDLFFGINNVSWTASPDLQMDTITYDLEVNYGSVWELLATNISTPYYEWDITFFYDGTLDLRVKAIDENNGSSDYATSTNVNLDTSGYAVQVSETFIPQSNPIANTTLDCGFKVNNNLSANPIDVTVTWQNTFNNIDWNNITTYDFTYVGVTENLQIITGLGTGSVTEDLTGTWSWRCVVEATNGAYS